MSDVTRILNAIEQGDGQASEQLLPLVYDELRKLSAEFLMPMGETCDEKLVRGKPTKYTFQ